MHGLQTAAFALLAIVFLVRIPSAMREPRSRLSWLASGVGAVALLTLGTVVPQSALDGLLGGTNILKLVQTILATVAFWLVTRAALGRERTAVHRIRFWQVAIMIVAFSVPFFFIDGRGGTTYYFLEAHIDQTGTWLFATIYMASVAYLSAALLLSVRWRTARAYRLFILGACLVVVACTDEITALTLNHLDAPVPLVRSVTSALFDPLFYVGIILIVGGIASFTLAKRIRELSLHIRVRGLQAIAIRHGINVTVHLLPGETAGPLDSAYDLIIAIRDSELTGATALTGSETRWLTRTERLIMRQLNGPSASGQFGPSVVHTTGAAS